MDNEYTYHDNPEPEYIPDDRHGKKRKRFVIILAITVSMIICVGLGYRIGIVTEREKPDTTAGLIQNEASDILESQDTADNAGNNPNVADGMESAENNNEPLQLLTDSYGSELTIADIASAASDSVVEITTEYVTTGNFMQQYVSSGAGSGVIITDDGYILTNNHVIEDASNITVTLTDQTSYDAELVGRDEDLDIALIKADVTGLNEASLGDSSELTVGETVVAIGNPLGQLGGTVTDGIISALDREITMNGRSMNLLQTNAAINPGNSGGGLFNNEGQLIGIVVAKSSGEDVEGLGFAVPINDVSEILNDLLEYGYVRNKVSLGVTLLDINTEQMAMMYGVRYIGTYIYSVEEDSAAAAANLQPGDCILSINGTEVTSTDDVKSILSDTDVGDVLTFEIVRNDQTMTLEVTAGEYVPEDIRRSETLDNNNY